MKPKGFDALPFNSICYVSIRHDTKDNTDTKVVETKRLYRLK